MREVLPSKEMCKAWSLGRLALPILVIAMATYATWGRDYESIRHALFGTAFILHLFVTVFLKRTDVLDTASVFVLFLPLAGIADYSKSEVHGPLARHAVEIASGFAAYAVMSLVGIRRAYLAAPVAPRHSISRTAGYGISIAAAATIVSALLFLDSKNGGAILLFVPFFFLLGVILFAFFRRVR